MVFDQLKSVAFEDAAIVWELPHSQSGGNAEASIHQLDQRTTESACQAIGRNSKFRNDPAGVRNRWPLNSRGQCFDLIFRQAIEKEVSGDQIVCLDRLKPTRIRLNESDTAQPTRCQGGAATRGTASSR